PDDPAIAAALESLRGRTRKNAAAAIEDRACHSARQRERIDMAARAVPEAAIPGFRAEHRLHLLARQQLDGCTTGGPLPHTALGDPDPAGRMHRLDPASLLLLGLDLVATGEIEQRGGTVAQHRDEALAGRTVSGDDIVRVRPRQCRDHLAVVA